MTQAKGSARWALAVFGVLAVASVPLYLVLARHEWFLLDEWDFLAARTAWNIGDLLRPHTNHWTTLPMLAWRALWSMVGLHSYLPYVFLSVLGHVAVASLTRTVMRRAGVDAWIATLVAGALLFFGAGAENIMYAFQITFTGALVFGLTQLLLADHDGALDRRDWLGLFAGLLGLMCSGVGVAMVAAVGVATLLRRGWRVAAFHVVPPAVMFLAWWARYGRSVTRLTGDVAGTLGFVRRALTTTFASLGQVIGIGALIAIALVAGVVLAWRAADPSTRRAQLAAPAALAVGALLFLVTTGVGRTGAQKVLDDPGASRYQYVAAVLLLPALAVAIDALFRRRRAVGLVAIALLLVGVPGNLSDASRFARNEARVTAGSRAMVLSIGRLPRAGRVPAAMLPDPNRTPWVTMGWIRSGVRDGRIPAPAHPADRALLETDRLRLALMQVDTARGSRCASLRRPLDRRLRRGAHLGLGNGSVSVQLLVSGRLRGLPIAYGNALFGVGPDDHELEALVGPLHVRIAPIPGKPAQLC